jgi:hypothetical protein
VLLQTLSLAFPTFVGYCLIAMNLDFFRKQTI